LVFASAVAALFAAGRPLLGIAFALVTSASIALMFVWRQRGSA
jgi:hypothetical protein